MTSVGYEWEAWIKTTEQYPGRIWAYATSSINIITELHGPWILWEDTYAVDTKQPLEMVLISPNIISVCAVESFVSEA